MIISSADLELARAAKRLIVSTERLIDPKQIRMAPEQTVIPFFLVDAVVVAPFGCYPGNMPYEYFSDEDHLAEDLLAGDLAEDLLLAGRERIEFGILCDRHRT